MKWLIKILATLIVLTPGCSSATFSNMFGGEKLKTYEFKESMQPKSKKMIIIRKAGSSFIVKEK